MTNWHDDLKSSYEATVPRSPEYRTHPATYPGFYFSGRRNPEKIVLVYGDNLEISENK